jgi:hypothetical protein
LLRRRKAGQQIVEGGAGARRRARLDSDDEVRSLHPNVNVIGVVGLDGASEAFGLGRGAARATGDDRHFFEVRFPFGGGGDGFPPVGWAPGPRLNAPETIGAVVVRRAVSVDA